jgi:aminomethyltransferase
MPLSWRFSVLADRHRALGSKLEDWSGMGTAWTYNEDLVEQHATVRTAAGLMDVSGLKKVHLVGPHAIAVLDYITTRDLTKVYPGKSVYACMLNERGMFTDDCIVYRTGPNSWMLVHGSGTAHEEVVKQAYGRNCAVLFDDDLHDLSLQGPVAVDFLAKHVSGIRDLKYFHHMQTTLFGAPVMISRTGYTGERGYEIFCRGQDAGMIWDTILDQGKSMGIKPVCFTTLDFLRVESYLLFYPYDNSQMYPFPDQPPGDSLWELGLDFTVSPGTISSRARSASRSSASSLRATRWPKAGTNSGPMARRLASSHAPAIRSSPRRAWPSSASTCLMPSRAHLSKCAARTSRPRPSPIPSASMIPRRRSARRLVKESACSLLASRAARSTAA